MSIFIGSSCVGYGNTTPDTTVNEIRFVQSERHHPIDWNTVEMSLANKIKMIINIDSYGDGHNRGWHSEANLRGFTEEILTTLIPKAYNNNGISLGKLKEFTICISSEVEQNKIAKLVLGKTFHLSDIVAYILGIFCVLIVEFKFSKPSQIND